MKILKLKITEKNILSIRTTIYSFLNKYEKYEVFFIKDVPFCYIPDAYDHVIYKPSKTVRIKICKKCRLQYICKGIKKGSIFEKYHFILKPVLEKPREVVIEISNKCMLSCKMCFKTKTPEISLSYKELKKIIDDIKSNNVKNIRFTGGEPFLNKDIFRILDYCKPNFYLTVNSSLFLNKRIIKNLAKRVDNLLVSLQGFNKYSEKYFTGLDCLEIKLKNLNYLLEHIPIIRIGSVITKTLIENFEKYLKIIPSSVKVWELYRPMIKKIENNYFLKDYLLSANDYNTLLSKIDQQNKLNIKISNPIPYCVINKKFHKHILGSMYDDGNSRIVYDSKGYYKPSYYIDINIGRNVNEAWNNKKLIEITYLRKFHNKCEKCIYLLKCMGGSYYLGIHKKNKFIDVMFLK